MITPSENEQYTEQATGQTIDQTAEENTVEMSQEFLEGALEALLFVTDEPVNVLTLADALGIKSPQVEAALDALQNELLQANRGIQLREVAGGWRLVTHPQYHDILSGYVASWDTRKLSQAALETLAIVAYCQPVTRNEISAIRGVSSDSSINSLLEKDLVREVGIQESAGNPTTYGTSKAFLEKFGLKTLSELPPLESFAPDEETKKLISERLQVVREHDGYASQADYLEGEDRVVVADAATTTPVTAAMTTEAIETTTTPSAGSVTAMTAGVSASASAATSAATGAATASTPMDAATAAAADAAQEALRQAMQDGLASAVGVVDKINFDELVFEDDDFETEVSEEDMRS